MKAPGSTSLVALVLAAACGCAHRASECTPRGREAHNPSQSRIVGFVRHEQTKEAIEGVTVRVYSTRFRGPLVTKTDSKGAYRFASLAPGVYVIQMQSDNEKWIPAKWVELDGALTYRADFGTVPPPTRDPDAPWRVRLENRRGDPLRRFLRASGRPACP